MIVRTTQKINYLYTGSLIDREASLIVVANADLMFVSGKGFCVVGAHTGIGNGDGKRS